MSYLKLLDTERDTKLKGIKDDQNACSVVSVTCRTFSSKRISGLSFFKAGNKEAEVTEGDPTPYISDV